MNKLNSRLILLVCVLELVVIMGLGTTALRFHSLLYTRSSLQNTYDKSQQLLGQAAQIETFNRDIKNYQHILENMQSTRLVATTPAEAQEAILALVRTHLSATTPCLLINQTLAEPVALDKGGWRIAISIEFSCPTETFLELLYDLEYAPFAIEIKDLDISNKYPQGIYGQMTLLATCFSADAKTI